MSFRTQLQQGPLTLRVDPMLGARVTHFCFNQLNVLFEGAPQWGSTFWPSPQHAWGWPPPPVLDSEPYETHHIEKGLSFSSSLCPITGLVLHKKIVAAGNGFAVTYQMSNHSSKPVSFAPWEITRVAGGITFFVSELEPLSHSSLSLTRYANTLWHEYNVGEQNGHHLKAFANGSSGWLANVNQGLLLLKQFPQILPKLIAPSEAEVEIYTHGDPAEAYIELEQQGAYQTLLPGEESHWTVYWSLFEIPPEIEVGLGSRSLQQWVESLLKL